MRKAREVLHRAAADQASSLRCLLGKLAIVTSEEENNAGLLPREEENDDDNDGDASFCSEANVRAEWDEFALDLEYSYSSGPPPPHCLPASP